MSGKDFQTLGLNTEASLDEIKRAYRRLTLLYHPDKCGGDLSMFKKIKDAYQKVLKMKTGNGNCFVHEEFKNQHRDFLNQKPKSTEVKPSVPIRVSDGESDNRSDSGKSQTTDLVDHFSVEKFNEVFEKQNKNQKDLISNDRPLNFDHYRNEYQQQGPHVENVLDGASNANPKDFNDTFNSQFEHVNKSYLEKKTGALTEYTGDPVPMIGGFTSQNAFFEDDGQGASAQVDGEIETDGLLWTGGLEGHAFTSLETEDSLARNPRKKELLSKKECVDHKKTKASTTAAPALDIQNSIAKLAALKESRRNQLLASARKITNKGK